MHTLGHVLVGTVADGEEMRGHLITPLAHVDLDGTVGVDGVTLVGVDGDTEETRVGVDKLGLVTGLEDVEDGGIVEEGQVGHILTLLVLGRVDLSDLLLLEVLHLATGNLDCYQLVSLRTLKLTLDEALIGIRTPVGLLGIIRLRLILHPLLPRDEKVFSGIGVGTRALLDVAGHGGGAGSTTGRQTQTARFPCKMKQSLR